HAAATFLRYACLYWAAVGIGAAALAAACSASQANDQSAFGTGGGRSASPSGTGCELNIGPGGSHPAGPTGVGGGCAATTTNAKQIPLDLFIMLDRSDSMNAPTASGKSEWDAVTSAITAFVHQGAPVAGIGVGIQFFALPSSLQCASKTCSND